MAELQRIVSVLPEGEMNHNVLRNAIDLLAAEIESRGIEPSMATVTVFSGTCSATPPSRVAESISAIASTT